MKLRQVDFLSDAQYRSLTSYKADTLMMRAGMVCICITASVVLQLILLT